jgi:hypothetical protein
MNGKIEKPLQGKIWLRKIITRGSLIKKFGKVNDE